MYDVTNRINRSCLINCIVEDFAHNEKYGVRVNFYHTVSGVASNPRESTTSLAAMAHKALSRHPLLSNCCPRFGAFRGRRCVQPTRCAAATAEVMLEVKDLEAKIAATGQPILKGVNLTIRNGEVHAIMGKNGSGKSTLSKVLVGHPDYEVTSGSAVFKGKNLFEMEPEERSHAGLFLSFQTPIEVPGVSNVDFLRMACNARRKALGQSELDPLEFYAYIMPKVTCSPASEPYSFPCAQSQLSTDGFLHAARDA